jgi:hypothetical protein
MKSVMSNFQFGHFHNNKNNNIVNIRNISTANIRCKGMYSFAFHATNVKSSTDLSHYLLRSSKDYDTNFISSFTRAQSNSSTNSSHMSFSHGHSSAVLKKCNDNADRCSDRPVFSKSHCPVNVNSHGDVETLLTNMIMISLLLVLYLISSSSLFGISSDVSLYVAC